MNDAAPASRRFREGLALILLAVCAILLQRAATTAWSVATAADGTRYEVSPIGLARLDSTGSAETSCRWWPRLGDLEMCAIASPEAFRWLRRTYPFTVIALWTSVLALFLNALRVPRSTPVVRLASAVAVPALALLALWCLGATASTAMTVLGGAALRPLAGGFGVVAAATALSVVATGLLVLERRPAQRGS